MNKEIIKELGWIHIGGFWYDWPIKDTIEIEQYSNRALDFRLNFVNEEKYILIEAYERNSFDWEIVFAGPVQTKEELEFLMKIFKLI